jgi:hypothetical protein
MVELLISFVCFCVAVGFFLVLQNRTTGFEIKSL